MKRDIAEGRIVSGDRLKITVADAMRAHLREIEERVVARTLADYKRLAEKIIIPAIDKVRAHALRRPDVTRMLANVNGKRQRQYAYVVAKAALAPHVRHVDPVEHPFPPRSTPKIEKREPLQMTLAQSKRVFTQLADDRHALIYITAATTGIRESEILGLRWRDVGNDHLSITMKLDESTRALEETKTKRGHRVDIPKSLSRMLKEHRKARGSYKTAPNDFVFLNDAGRPILASNLRRSWRATRERLGLDKSVRIYDLRHLHATLLLGNGVHPKIAQERLNHSTSRITMDTYSHTLPGMQKPAVDLMGA